MRTKTPSTLFEVPCLVSSCFMNTSSDEASNVTHSNSGSHECNIRNNTQNHVTGRAQFIFICTKTDWGQRSISEDYHRSPETPQAPGAVFASCKRLTILSPRRGPDYASLIISSVAFNYDAFCLYRLGFFSVVDVNNMKNIQVDIPLSSQVHNETQLHSSVSFGTDLHDKYCNININSLSVTLPGAGLN